MPPSSRSSYHFFTKSLSVRAGTSSMKVTLVGRQLPQGNVMEMKLFILTALMSVIAAFAHARRSPPAVPAQPEG